MKRFFFLIFAFSLFLTSLNFSDQLIAQQKEKIIKGQVIEIYSYVTTGKIVKETMLESSKNGNPLGILSSGKVYLVFPEDQKTKTNDILTPFLCEKIVAKGKIFNKGSINILILSNIDRDMKAK